MKRLSLTTILALSAWTFVSAADAPKEKPGVMEAAAVSAKVTVEAIDYKTRTITLKKEDGTLTALNVGSEVTRFNEIKKGDIIKVDYLESVAVVVTSPDDKLTSAQGSQSVLIRNEGKKPSATKVDTDVITATVEKIDAKKRTATLKGPEGNLLDITIAPDVQHLENVKKGDKLVVKLTRTVLIDVSKPTK